MIKGGSMLRRVSFGSPRISARVAPAVGLLALALSLMLAVPAAADSGSITTPAGTAVWGSDGSLAGYPTFSFAMVDYVRCLTMSIGTCPRPTLPQPPQLSGGVTGAGYSYYAGQSDKNMPLACAVVSVPATTIPGPGTITATGITNCFLQGKDDHLTYGLVFPASTATSVVPGAVATYVTAVVAAPDEKYRLCVSGYALYSNNTGYGYGSGSSPICGQYL